MSREEPQYIYGPVTEGECFLYTLLDRSYYYLKLDPKPGYPPYFGLASPRKEQLSLGLELGENPRLVSGTGSGFLQDHELQTAILSTSSNGDFTFLYFDTVSSGTGLLFGVFIRLLVDGVELTFKWKSPESEEIDKNASSIDYKPTYDGDVVGYFLAPLTAYKPGECEASPYDNGVFLAYSNDPQYAAIWYSTPEWCLADQPFEPCKSGDCGFCYGPCEDQETECSPDPKTGELECRSPVPVKKPWYEQVWVWVLIGFGIFLLLVIGVYFLLQRKKSHAIPAKIGP